MLARHVLPPTLLLGAVVIAFDPGLPAVSAPLHALAGALLTNAIVAWGTPAQVPVAHPFRAGEQTGHIGLVLLNVLLVSLLGAVHAAVVFLAPWAFVVTVPALAALALAWLGAIAARLDADPPAELRPRPRGRAIGERGPARTSGVPR
jgi:hypothetical protein